MATGVQKQATYKRSSYDHQAAVVTCRCRDCKKTLCQYCKKSPQKFKILKGETTDNLTVEPEVVIFPDVVTEVDGRRFATQSWDVNFSEYFSKEFKKVLEIKPGGWCCNIKYFNGKIWAPTPNGYLMVYNKIGNTLKTLDLKSSISIAQADNNDIFIACYNKLYVMDDSEAPKKIFDKSIADVYAHRDKLYALEYKKKVIMDFFCRPDLCDVKQRWRSEREWGVNEAGYCDRLIVTGDVDLQFYVSHHGSHKISQYNTQGQCIKQFGSKQETGNGNLHYPRLCGIDKQSHLLVADQGNNLYKILDPGTGDWRFTGVRGVGTVYDATLDDEGNLWLSQHNGKAYIITKHEPQ